VASTLGTHVDQFHRGNVSLRNLNEVHSYCKYIGQKRKLNSSTEIKLPRRDTVKMYSCRDLGCPPGGRRGGDMVGTALQLIFPTGGCDDGRMLAGTKSTGTNNRSCKRTGGGCRYAGAAAAAASAPPPMNAMRQVPASLMIGRTELSVRRFGAFHLKISTSSAQAQQYFDQGMRLMWAFNHDESHAHSRRPRSWTPSVAICLWGVALTSGANYNMPMMAEPRAKVAYRVCSTRCSCSIRPAARNRP